MDSVTVDHWSSDRLGRKQDAEFLYNFLVGQTAKRRTQGQTGSYVLNVDADWGGGKTFFLDRLAQDIEGHGHLVARINAWRDDHAQDPYVAIMAAIDKAFAPYVKKPGKIAKAWAATKMSGGPIAVKVGGAIIKGLWNNYSGTSLDELSALVSSENGGPLENIVETAFEAGTKEAGGQLERLFDTALETLIDGFKQTDKAMLDFREKLKSAVEAVSSEKKSPLFILVDELDRCRPTYAVQLLERVKHLFDVDGVVFVFATNADQLQHSIAGAYGANFDGFRYLKRFFDRTYVFEEPSIEGYVATLCDTLPKGKLRAPEDALVRALTIGCKVFGFDLRAIGHIIEMIDATASAWPHPLPIDVVLLFPLCAHFYSTGKAGWPDGKSEKMKAWVFHRTHYDRFERQEVNTSIIYADIYRLSLGMFKSLSKISNLDRPSTQSSASNYAFATFDPEWNNVPLDRDSSIQTDLLSLVANAGRMTHAQPR